VIQSREGYANTGEREHRTILSQLPADCGSQILEKAFISRVSLVRLDMTRLGVGI
jgi:hypothetical protein